MIPGSPAASRSSGDDDDAEAEWVGTPTLHYRNGVLSAAVPYYGKAEDPLAAYEKSWERWIKTWAADWTKHIGHSWRTVVFVARYTGQDIDTIENWPLSKLRRVAAFTVEYLEGESKSGRTGLGPRGGAGR